jgi:cytochrome c
MKSILLLSAVVLWLPGRAAIADDEFYKTKNCVACHRVDRNSMGPSFNSIAAKYADDKDADVKLAKKIREGGAGVWGSTPMPAQSQVSEDESLTLARWVLALK